MHCALFVFYEANKDDYYCSANNVASTKTIIHGHKHVLVENDLYDKMLVICRTMSLFILLEHFEVLVLKVGH